MTLIFQQVTSRGATVTKQAETSFKERVLPRLRKIPNSWWVKIQQVGIRGTPDILGCIAGAFVAIELKQSATAHIDALQRHELYRIGEAGGVAMVMHPDNMEELFAALEGYGAEGINPDGTGDAKVYKRGSESGPDCG